MFHFVETEILIFIDPRSGGQYSQQQVLFIRITAYAAKKNVDLRGAGLENFLLFCLDG